MKSGVYGQESLARINRLIDEQTGPGMMTPEEALDFLEHLQSDLEGKIDRLRDDVMKSLEGDDE